MAEIRVWTKFGHTVKLRKNLRNSSTVNSFSVKMSFDKLPIELVENIFSYLDAPNFCKVKRVCKKWLHYAEELESQEHWKAFCIKDIPSYVIEELISFKEIPVKYSGIAWASIYRRWCKGNIPLRKEKRISSDAFETIPDRPIVCVAISGSFVLTGHNYGYVCVWDHETGKLIQECICHQRSVSAILLIDLMNFGPYHYEENLFWCHHHLITGSNDCTVRIKSVFQPLLTTDDDIILREHIDSICSLKVFERKLLVHSWDNTISLHALDVEKYPSLQCSLLRKIVGPDEIIASVGLWRNEIFCVCRQYGYYTYNSKMNTWLEEDHFKIRFGSLSPLTMSDAVRNKVIVLVTNRKQLAISIDQSNFTCFTMHDQISSFKYKGTILAFADNEGVLYLVAAPRNESLLNVAAFTCSLNLGKDPIIAIDISYQKDYPVIVACSSHTINVIRCHVGKGEDPIAPSPRDLIYRLIV